MKFQLVYLLFLWPIIASQANNKNKIKQLHIFFRHGERTPSETYKNDPYVNYPWPGGWGQLTNRGKLQMHILGQKYRQIYNTSIPELYFKENIEITSSYSDRCLMSAEVFLAGLFPPKGDQIWNKELLWQPMPVKYVPRNQDTLIAMKKSCKKYDKMFNDLFNSEEMKIIDKNNAELYENLTKFTGQDMNGIDKVELLYNTLEIELLNNLTLPEWIDNVSWEQMRFLAAKTLAIYTNNNYMKRMKGGVFLNKTINAMKYNQQPYIYLYAGHDISIVNILRCLGIDLLKPGFAASFVVEFYENSEVKIFYRDDVYKNGEQLEIPNCQPPCYLKNFEESLLPLLPKNWEEECDNI